MIKGQLYGKIHYPDTNDVVEPYAYISSNKRYVCRNKVNVSKDINSIPTDVLFIITPAVLSSAGVKAWVKENISTDVIWVM